MICVDTTFLIDLWRNRDHEDQPDLWIAAWALEHGAQLATRNRKHFENVPDLRLVTY